MPDEVLAYVRERLAERGIGKGLVSPPSRTGVVAVLLRSNAAVYLFLGDAYRLHKSRANWRAEVDNEIRRQMREAA